MKCSKPNPRQYQADLNLKNFPIIPRNIQSQMNLKGIGALVG
jgi:hypothetical protein